MPGPSLWSRPWRRKTGCEALSAGFATCPLTQTGLVRISSNPNFTPEAVSPREALVLLNRITAVAGHRFWPDDLALHEVLGADPPIMGHRQVTDAYLLALAAGHGGKLATLDRAVLSLPGAPRGVELLQSS